MTEYIDKDTARIIVGDAIVNGKSWFDALANIPPADVCAIKRGLWEWNKDNGYYYCSECGAVSPRKDQDGEYCDCPNYCPNCGNKMGGAINE